MWAFFFFKQKTAYEMRISDWSSDVCSSDLSDLRSRDRDAVETANRVYPGEIQPTGRPAEQQAPGDDADHQPKHYAGIDAPEFHDARYGGRAELFARSEEHKLELQSLMRIS